jgi:hypothetical protein
MNQPRKNGTGWLPLAVWQLAGAALAIIITLGLQVADNQWPKTASPESALWVGYLSLLSITPAIILVGLFGLDWRVGLDPAEITPARLIVIVLVNSMLFVLITTLLYFTVKFLTSRRKRRQNHEHENSSV